jgi:hypothetical protein
MMEGISASASPFYRMNLMVLSTMHDGLVMTAMCGHPAFCWMALAFSAW